MFDARAYEAAFHLSPLAIAFAATDGSLLARNPAFLQTIGARSAEPPSLSEALGLPQDRVETLLRAATAWGQVTEEVTRRAEGEDLPLLVEARLFVTGEGNRLYQITLEDLRQRRTRERDRAVALEIARAANRATDEDALAGRIAEATRSALPEGTDVAVFRVEADRFACRALLGESAPPAAHLHVPLEAADETFIGYARSTRDTAFLVDVALEPVQHDLLLPNVTSAAAVPALIGDHVAGVILAGTRGARRLAIEDVRVIELAGEEYAAGLGRLGMNRSLRRALDSIRSTHEDLEEFVLWTTHELREPLRRLATVARYLIEHIPRSDTEGQALASHLVATSELLKRRIYGLADLGVALRDDPRDQRPAGLGDIVDVVLDELQPDLRQSGADVQVAHPFPSLDLPERHLFVILHHLVHNAVKFSGSRDSPVVRIAATAHGDEVSITVEDNGPGIPPSLRERVLRPFHGDAEGSRGRGIGLAVVLRLAAKHGGAVTIGDSPLGGARVTVAFPVPASSGAVERAPSERAERATHP